MKKVYILTFHCAYNVGAMLQCHALSEAIKKLGFVPQVIDYRDEMICHPSLNQMSSLSLFEKLKKTLENLFYFIYRLMRGIIDRKRRINIFFGDTITSFFNFMKKYMPLTERIFYNKKELIEAFSNSDAKFITGSDQVFNPALCKNIDVYLLDFVKKGSKNSYAASFGKGVIDESFKEVLKNTLCDYNILSVREESGKKIIKNSADKEAYAVLDPVFLKEKCQWEKLIYKVRIPGPYIFVYRMESNDKINLIIESLKNENPALKVVKFDDIADSLNADFIISKKAPIDFLSYLYASSYVITNSFHGTAFSVIFGKNAFVLPHSTYNERIASLMNDLNVSFNENGVYNLNTDAYLKLSDKIKYSFNILKEILEG